jgi:hypothetical protein
VPRRVRIPPYPPFPRFLAPPPLDDESWSDEQLALLFLVGFGGIDASGCTHGPYYLEDGSSDENVARAAFVKVLRSGEPLSPELRNLMADLFDATATNPRKLVFRFRREGSQGDPRGAFEVAMYVVQRLHPREFESAVQSAMSKFGLKRGAVLGALKRYRSLVETRASSLPPPKNK